LHHGALLRLAHLSKHSQQTAPTRQLRARPLFWCLQLVAVAVVVERIVIAVLVVVVVLAVQQFVFIQALKWEAPQQ
jgi:hypothetical protein